MKQLGFASGSFIRAPEQLHVIERFRRPDFDHLECDTTIDDPGAHTKPFTMYGRSTYAHGMELMEFICNENNKDVDHIVGKVRAITTQIRARTSSRGAGFDW